MYCALCNDKEIFEIITLCQELQFLLYSKIL